jgi:hypothetical protein
MGPVHDPRRQRTLRLLVLIGLGLAAVVVVISLPGGSGKQSPARSGAPVATTVPPSTAPATTAPTSTTRVPATRASLPPPTAAAPDPGSLPQTGALPSAADPSFQTRVRDLWRAMVDGVPAEGLPFFFPLGAYIQVKGISDPVHDYQTRLIVDYEQDIMTLHADLGAASASATMTGVTVPDEAEWIRPGVEYNKGSYWRVYGTRVSYLAGGVPGSFAVTSMISWRGEWYVVHLSSIR